MFGYIRISKPEMRVKEYDMYKAVYCSLCKNLGKEYGFMTRFALNYDFTFTALMSLALKDGFDGTENKRCVCNPFKKCTFCCEEEPFSLSCAALMILSHYKFADDIKDEKGIKKAVAFLLFKLYGGAYKKAKSKYPQIDEAAREYTDEQTLVESSGQCTLDDAAAPSSKMLSRLFAMCGDTQNNKQVLSHLGMLLGRYIYLLDCLTDRNDDIKKDTFNPLKNVSYEQAKERVKTQLYIVINEAEKTFELLDVKRFKNILANIIYVGLEDTMNSEINRMEKKK